MALLEIRNLHAQVGGGGRKILKGVDLTVNKGEIHAIMGLNGSGKSTLCQVLAGREVYEVTEGTATFNGKDLFELSAEERARAIFHPYHDEIRAALDRRRTERRLTVLVAMHTFTPVFLEVPRPWHVGVLYNRDSRVARQLLQALRSEGDLVVGDNQPYAVGDLTDYSVVNHGERRGIPHVEIEIRQDLVADERGQEAWAQRFARVLPLVIQSLPTLNTPPAG